MIRGTTPTHTFVLPFDVSVIDKLRIVYAQDEVVKITKTDGDATLRGDTVSVRLTQEETLLLDCKKSVEIQVRVLTPAGDALTSDIIRIPISRCLDSEVMV